MTKAGGGFWILHIVRCLEYLLQALFQSTKRLDLLIFRSSAPSTEKDMVLSDEYSGPTYDVLIIGAGLSGIYSHYEIRKRFPTWRIGVIEAGADVGGVWYWNKYPGCQIDTESFPIAILLTESSWKNGTGKMSSLFN